VEGERSEFQIVCKLDYQAFLRISGLLSILYAMIFISTATMGLYGNLSDETSWKFLAVWGLRKFYVIFLVKQDCNDRALLIVPL
jgi:hypothetical protein